MFKFAKTLMMVGGLGLGLLAASTPARAHLNPTNASLPTPVMGGFQWDFDVLLSGDQFLVSGDFFTIYDFAGFVPGSNIEPNALWDFSSALVGVTPSGEIIPDNASLPNLTWTYVGPNTPNGPTDLGQFSAISTFGTPVSGFYGAMARQVSIIPAVHGDPTMNKGPIAVPSNVPEPGTMALLGLGAAPLIGRLRRRSRKA
jgi:hypothetical protein